jgi:hypothetical protein
MQPLAQHSKELIGYDRLGEIVRRARFKALFAIAFIAWP